ncbi:beta-glucosidase BglX [Pedobacter nutrimenti]|uniref:beta-glucosidase n=1 Tax=Pedobacter nutrimenti TaxID=1241337 RepID=A0A318UIB0_9SPHI|nr:beta-glucosidase BglX [Pedobacter nutrimenti]PYF74778.1 beta-glucosidase [Pedobacter nutrimenti]
MRQILSFLFFLSFVYTLAGAQTKVPYKNASLPVEARVKDLLQRMTVEEKAGQLNQIVGDLLTGPSSGNAGWQSKIKLIKEGKVGSMLNVVGATNTRAVQEIALKESRLGIPVIFGYDVIHGYKTIFPIPLAEACSWDIPQMEINAAIAAKETAAAGVHWTFAPMCDISNDPRWGRVMEGIGEDPWYGGLVSAARVKGLQGNLDPDHILACLKHYVGYGNVEAGKEYNRTDMSRVELWNKYLPPFKAAIEAGAATVMNGFNTFEGTPVSASKYLVTDVLKKKWGFKGFLVSDWNSFGEMINWGYASDQKDVAYKAFSAGSMMDMETQAMVEYIPLLIKEGKIKMAELDEAVGRILYYKFKLGLFDGQHRFTDPKRESASLFTEENRQQALKAAKRSVVLLKNNQQTLPLNVNSKKIALIGFYARSKNDLFDFWVAQGDSSQAVSLYEGMMRRFGENKISYSDGYRADASTNEHLINEAVANAASADVVVLNIGLSGKLAGEDRSLAYPEIPEGQIALLKALKKTGKQIITVVSAGRPLVLTPIQDLSDAILYTWILGTENGNAVAQILAGDENPSGKTVLSFPYAVGQIPVYYNHFNTGRPSTTDGQGNWYSRYRDIPNKPLYPFGYGLSYTHFSYGNLSLSSNVKQRGKALQVKVTLSNDGAYDGEEVVQLYIQDVVANIVRPVKELKAFQKVLLKKGEQKTLVFTLGDQELSYYNAEGNPVLEPGRFKVFVGGNSQEVLEQSFELK